MEERRGNLCLITIITTFIAITISVFYNYCFTKTQP
jgi:hypothetical protein